MGRGTQREIQRVNPEVMVMMVGGNDISFDRDADEIAAAIETFATVCVNRLAIRRVIVCQVMPRFSAPYRLLKQVPRSKRREWERRYLSMYRTKAREINRLLGIALFTSRSIRFWDHNGKFKADSCDHKYDADGIHLNEKGQWHLYKSLRGAINSAF